MSLGLWILSLPLCLGAVAGVLEPVGPTLPPFLLNLQDAPGQEPLPAPGKPLPYMPVAPEPAAPDACDIHDAFRRDLLDGRNSEHYLVKSSSAEILLVVQKGYLDAAALKRFSSDLLEAAAEIPKLAGRVSKIKGRFTVYAYDQTFLEKDTPISQADVPRAKPGERGVMLRFAKEDRAPVFHELTHLLVGHSSSQSLAEGLADYVEERLRPGKARSFVPAKTDPHREARAAIRRYPPRFLETIGAPGRHSWSAPEVRFSFYYASWSFADHLIRLKGLKTFLAVMDSGGEERAYLKTYGKGLEELRRDWVREIESRP